MRRVFGIVFGLFSLSFIYVMFLAINELNISTMLFFIIIAAIFGYFSYRCFYKSSKKYMAIRRKKEILNDTSLTEETLAELENGTMPVVYVDNLILEPDEECRYYSNAMRLIVKEKVMGYEGRSAGININIAKGIGLGTRNYKGAPIRGDVAEETKGRLFITDKRIIFMSNKNSFNINIGKIIATEYYSDGIGIQDNNNTYIIKLIAPEIPLSILRVLITANQAS